MSGGGAFGPAAQAVGQANQTTPTSGAAYTPVQQGSVYQPQYQQYQPQQRAPQYQQQTPNYQSGLQAAMMQMIQQYSRPMMRAPLQQGISPSSPLAYRPPAVANLNRVAPGVVKTNSGDGGDGGGDGSTNGGALQAYHDISGTG
jgi:hypothetical protein